MADRECRLEQSVQVGLVNCRLEQSVQVGLVNCRLEQSVQVGLVNCRLEQSVQVGLVNCRLEQSVQVGLVNCRLEQSVQVGLVNCYSSVQPHALLAPLVKLVNWQGAVYMWWYIWDFTENYIGGGGGNFRHTNTSESQTYRVEYRRTVCFSLL